MAYTKEIINVGSTVDDGTGDLLRDAFTKVNTNFTNIWDKGGVNSNLNLTEFSITSDGDLILNPTSDLLIKKQTIINSDKGNFDLVVHGDTSDNVLYVDADTNRVGILTSTPTVALDVAGSLAVSVTTTTGNLSVTGNTILGNDVADLVSINGRIGTDILPSGSRSIGSATNRYTKLSVTDIDATGTISGTFTGTIAPSTVITNTINTTSIASETLTATTSAEVGNLLVTGTLAVQGDSVTIDSATMQILDRLTFEGATADDFETSIVATDATADRTITLPDADGNIALFTTAPTGAIADGTSGQVLTTDGAGALSFTTVSGGGGAINGLSDVTITGATTGEVLKYNGTTWINDASGIALTDISVSVAAAGSSTLTYDDSNGSFEFTPPDLSTYLTSVPAQTFASLTGTPTTLAGYGITDGYANTDVDAHLNQSGPTDGYVLSWTSGDYAWVAQTGGSSYADSDVDTHLNTGSATANQILSWDGSDYVWVEDATGGAAGGNVTADGAGVLELSLDTSPVLGGTLDANGNTIDMGTNVLTDTNLGQFITAYGWGDHSGAGYLTSYTVSESDVTTHEAALTITESQISDLGSYLTTVAFADLTGKPTTIAGYGITDAATQYANSDVDTHLNTSSATSGQVLSWDGSDYAWAADATGGATSINTAGNTGTGSVTFASETLTVTGTTGQIDVDAAAWALSLSLDADLTGLSTINTHTIPGGTGTLALTTDYADGINVSDESSDTTCFPMFGTGATGALTVKTDQSAYTYNASTETLAVTNFSGNFSGKVVHTFVIAASGSTDYTFSDADNHWFPSTETDPVLYLRRGETYVLNVDALSGSHPFEIRVSNGGSAYGTGVTNNGATSGNITFKVPMSAPATLYYQCTAHAAMGNTINIV